MYMSAARERSLLVSGSSRRPDEARGRIEPRRMWKVSAPRPRPDRAAPSRPAVAHNREETQMRRQHVAACGAVAMVTTESLSRRVPMRHLTTAALVLYLGV